MFMKHFVFGLVFWAATSGFGQPPEMSTSSLSIEPITTPQLLSRLSGGTNAVTLVHVWATWCPPCGQEFPDVVRLAKTYREQGLRVFLVSADAERDRNAVSRFLVARGVDWPAYQAVNVNDTFVKALSQKWSGAIPASFFFAPGGTLREEWEGAHPFAAYEETVLKLLGESKKGEPGK
jgi:thiol-disulfide isomerase/thioredoxin